MNKSKGSFSLEDLDQMEIDGATPVSKPASKTAAARQGRAPATRKSTATATASKKRKSDSSIDLENFESLNFAEASEKMMNLHTLGRLVRIFSLLILYTQKLRILTLI